jgi:hypothetical protein
MGMGTSPVAGESTAAGNWITPGTNETTQANQPSECFVANPRNEPRIALRIVHIEQCRRRIILHDSDDLRRDGCGIRRVLRTRRRRRARRDGPARDAVAAEAAPPPSASRFTASAAETVPKLARSTPSIDWPFVLAILPVDDHATDQSRVAVVISDQT